MSTPLPIEIQNPPRRAYAAAAILAHKHGTTLAVIMTLANSKADAIAAAIVEASRTVPNDVGDSYAIINTHATGIDPEVIRAAADELAQPAELQ